MSSLTFELRDVLAELYPTVSDSRQVVAEAELDPLCITFDEKAITNWFNILEEAKKHVKVQAIVDIARQEYPEHEELVRISERLRNSASDRLRPVDREIELNIFTSLLTSSPPRSILFIVDRSGQGKTKLLELYEDRCKEKTVPVVRVDLKKSGNPIAILQFVQTKLDWHFQHCADFGQTSPGDMADSSLGRQRQLWADYARAFRDDLIEMAHFSQCERLVLLFDTFEGAMLATRIWIAEHLLDMAIPSRVSCLSIVLAGREVPAASGDWEPYHQPIPLQRLQLEAWLEYAARVNPALTHADVARLYEKHADNPTQMAKGINILSLQSRSLEDWLEYARLVASSLKREQIMRSYEKYADDSLKMAQIIEAFREVD